MYEPTHFPDDDDSTMDAGLRGMIEGAEMRGIKIPAELRARCMGEAGDATLANGDVVGHVFHGNQWTDGLGDTQSAKWLREDGRGRSSPITNDGVYVGTAKHEHGHIHGITKDALAWHLKHGSFSTVTAANPYGKEFTTNQNMRAMRSITRHLKKIGANYINVRGKYGKPEPSRLVFHSAAVTPKVVREIGAKYGQESVMNANKGRALIAFTTGPNVGKVVKSSGYTMDQDAETNYSKVSGHKFSFDFDFDRAESS